MDLSHVIIASVVTEKAERLKADDKHRTYTLTVAPQATKIDVANAIKRFYDLDVASVRVMRTRPKTRSAGRGTMEKRHRTKKVMVTLAPGSKALDLTAFHTA